MDVGPPSADGSVKGYASINISWPAELSFSYPRPSGWTFTVNAGTTTQDVSIQITSPTTNGTPGAIKNFLENPAAYMATKTPGAYPPPKSIVSLSAAATQKARFTDATGGIHFYEYVSGLVTWNAAYNKALGMSYLGAPGYLATFTSNAEQTLAFNSLGKKAGWLGGIRARDSNGNMKFLGWHEDAAFTKPFDFATPIIGDDPTGLTKTLYGKWDQYHNVTFNINNPSYGKTPTPQAIIDNGNAAPPLGLTINNVYGPNVGSGDARFGHKKFLGWFREGQSPGNGSPWSFTSSAVTADITLTAYWTQYYNVSFNINNTSYQGAAPTAGDGVPTRRSARSATAQAPIMTTIARKAASTLTSTRRRIPHA